MVSLMDGGPKYCPAAGFPWGPKICFAVSALGALTTFSEVVFIRGRKKMMNDLRLGDDLMVQSIALREPHVIL